MDYMAAQMDRQIEGAKHRYDEAMKEGEQPAFPVQAGEYGGHGTAFGMTLLDYFSAKALVGLLSWPGDDGSGSYHSNSNPAHTASMAYEYGKAMLAARVKP